MKITVSVKPRSVDERDFILRSLPDLPGKHSVPIPELLSNLFLLNVNCVRPQEFHEQYTKLDDDDHAGLDDLANTYTSIPTFVELMHRAAGDWVISQLKEKGISSHAKIKESAPAVPVAPSLDTETAPSEPTDNSDEENDAATAAEDALIFERLKLVDPNAYQFAVEKDIRLMPRPKWSRAFEWMRTYFDLEERTDSSGTYFAFLYSPGLSQYQKLTFLIHTIRRDKGFKEWLEENKIVERRPSTISPAPGTSEYLDYQDQLKEQSYALMAKLGATPEEIAARRRGDTANEWLGPEGKAWLILNIFSVAAKGDLRSAMQPVEAPTPKYQTWNQVREANSIIAKKPGKPGTYTKPIM